MDASVYFNPRCSNCRTVDGILQEHGVAVHHVRYLDQAPSIDDLEGVLAKLGTSDPRDILRTKEPPYDELNLASADRDQLLRAMVEHPILIQRPIVVVGNRAVVARPPERVLEILQ